jgi:autotransporter-associated beta strand protein
LLLSGNNSYTGNTTIAGSNSATATLKVGNSSALVSTSTVTLNSSQVKSTSRLDLGNGASSFNATIAGLFASSSAGTGRQGFSIVTNSSTGTGTGTLAVNPTSADNFNGLIQDGATAKVALAVGGSDTLTLSGVNSYTGGTTVSGGTLAVNANSGTTTDVTVTTVAVGTANQTATVTSSAGMAIGQAVSASNLAPGTYIMGISGNTLYLSASASSTGTQSGTFSGYQTMGNGTVTALDTGVLDLGTSTTTSVGAVNVSGGTIQNGTLTGTSYTTTSGSVSAGLAGSADLAQNGAGTTTLSGNNTYTGATTVSGGTLRVGASGAMTGATGLVTVSAGGELDSNVSSATLGGALTVSGGTLDPNGSSAGTFTLASAKNFTMSSGTFSLDLGTASDQLASAGGSASFSITGGTFALTLGAGFNYGNTYQVLSNFGGANTVSGLTFTGISGYTASLNTAGVLSFTVVPEPGTIAMLLSGLGMLVGFQRSRRRALR